jgi:hypothetical protein
MSDCIRATHRMEERYSRLILEFCDDKSKDKILNTIDEVIKDLKEEPTSVIESNSSVQHDMIGEIYIEFDDDYDKEAEDFHEMILHRLELTLCD